MRLAALWMLVAASPLVAQKMPASGDAARVVAAYELRPLLDLVVGNAGTIVRGDSVKPEQMREQCRKELCTAIRKFMTPPLGDGDQIAELGPDRLVALVRPEQATWIDQFLDGVQKVDLGAQLHAQFRLIDVDRKRLAEILQRDDLPDPLALTVDDRQMRELRRLADPGGHSGPTTLTWPHAEWMTFGSGMSFVKGWRKVTARASDEPVVAPELGTCFDGVEFELLYVPLPGSAIGFHLDAQIGIVDWDTPTRKQRIGEQDYVVDEPGQQQLRIDSALTMAAPKPLVFGRRTGDKFVLLTFEPKTR